MRPRPLAVALGVFICLALCLVTAAQRPLLLLALNWGVSYLFVPLLAVALWTFCLAEAAQTIWQEVQEWQRLASDVHLYYRLD